jgi:hypothetical protein
MELRFGGGPRKMMVYDDLQTLNRHYQRINGSD